MSSLPKAIFKSILVVVGIGAVLIAVVGVGGYLWFQQKKEEIREMGREARAEGRAYGRGRSPEECIAEALRRLQQADGLVEEASQRVFHRSCLRVAVAPARFCDGVPPSSEIMQSLSWATDYCTHAGFPDDRSCVRLLQVAQEYCHSRRR